MKKLLTVTLMLLCALSFTFAQLPTTNSEPTVEDYERYIDQRLEMSFRLNAIKAIELTPEEINAFNPVFDNYIAAKDRLSEKKFDILENYSEELEGEEDAEERSEETSDFIEDYWEAEIAEMELKKDYYDILENKIPYQKAIDFFLYEETVENSMKYDILIPKLPTVVSIEKDKKSKQMNPAMKTDDVTPKEWNRYIDKRLEMDFRLAAIEEMYLTPEEINTFNPFFDEYMNAKDKLTEKQFMLVDKYSKKIANEDDKEDRAEEMSDFIEDYWETEIAALQLKETYFDRMENDLPYFKVAQFFLFEETVENRMKFDAMSPKMPSIVIIEEQMKEKKKNRTDTKKTSKEKMTSSSTAEKNDASERMNAETEKATAESKEAANNAAMQADAIAEETKRAVEQDTENSKVPMMKEVDKSVTANGNEKTSKEMEKAKNYTDKKNSSTMSGNEKSGNSTVGDKNWDTKRSETTSKETEEGMTNAAKNKAEMKDVTVKTYADNEEKSTSTSKTVIKPFAKELTTFDTWVASKKGQMSLDHEYTHDGLMALTAAIEATAQATNTTIQDWAAKKATVNKVANSITIDPKSTMHADWVNEAFITLSEAVKALNDENEYTYAHGQVSLLQFKAKQINPDELLLQQASTVYDYFATANQALKDIWNYAAKSTATTKSTTVSSSEE